MACVASRIVRNVPCVKRVVMIGFGVCFFLFKFFN